MKLDPILKRARKLSRPYRVADGKGFRLRDYACDDTGEFGEEDRNQAHEILAEGIAAITELQDRLYAEDRWSLLLVMQAMDAAGKDSTIKHVMSGVNPQGCDVVAFKTPSTTELDHDYLWRVHKEVPSRGKIGIFNRSYYEEVLVVRVHPEFLGAQKLPPDLVGERIWEERYRQIRRFERHLAENGTRTVKFFLHVSRDEQKRRFLERIDDPAKHWKFSAADLRERARWKDYMHAYEEMIRHTATEDAPWYVIPADHKWYQQMIVGAAVVTALAELDPQYPEVSAEQRLDLARAKKALLTEQ